MGAAPMISVVIPAYNSGTTLGRALASVFAQTRVPDEIIVVDVSAGTDDGAQLWAQRLPLGFRLISTEGTMKVKHARAARNI